MGSEEFRNFDRTWIIIRNCITVDEKHAESRKRVNVAADVIESIGHLIKP